MENNRQYYTPDQEDLHKNYICQWLNGNQEWEDVILTKDTAAIDSKWLRTSFLDKQDIESLGWENSLSISKDGSPDAPHFYIDVEDKRYYLVLSKEAPISLLYKDGSKDYIYINNDYNLTISHDSQSYFYGICKSINELKKLMKMLNIPINGNK